MENRDTLKEIPLLNNIPLHSLKDQQVVRFKGMIQDIHDPEYYLKQYEVKNTRTNTHELRCGMYGDTAKCLVTISLKFIFYVAPLQVLHYPCST